MSIVLHISAVWLYVFVVNVICAQGAIINYQYEIKSDPCFNNHQYDEYDDFSPPTSCPTFTTTDRKIYYTILSFKSSFRYNPSDSEFRDYPLSLRIIDIPTELSANDLGGLFPGKQIFVLDLCHNNIKKIYPETFIPFIDLLELSLDWNSLSALDNYLSPLLNLQKVNLSRNSINTITDTSFANQLDLFVVDLSFNNISHIPKNTFTNQKYLEVLLLQGNQIKQFNLNFPEPNGAELKLDLSYNLLETASLPEYFTDINQSHNNLTVFSPVVSQKLQSLDLSYNYITAIDPSSFINAVNLYKLDLSHNLLTLIPTNSFKDVKQLQYLDLSHNLIHENSYGSDNNWFSFFLNFKELSQVALDGNHWKCSDLKEFIYLITSNRAQITHGSTHNTTNINGISCSHSNNTNSSVDQEITYNPSERIQSLINQQITEEFKSLYFNYTALLVLQTNESKVIMESLNSVKAEILKLKVALNSLNTTFNATDLEQQKGFSERVKDEILKLKVALNSLNTTLNAKDIEQQKRLNDTVKSEILKLKVAPNSENTTFNATDIEQQKSFNERVKAEILQLKVAVNSLNTTLPNLPNVRLQEDVKTRNSNEEIMMKILLDSVKTEMSKLKEALSSHPSTAEIKTMEHSSGNAGIIVANICLVIVACCLIFFIYVYYKNKHVVNSLEGEHINLS